MFNWFNWFNCVLKQLPLKTRIQYFYNINNLQLFEHENCYNLLANSIKYDNISLVNYAIEQGADNYNKGLIYAIRHDNFVDFFISLGATNYYESMIEAIYNNNLRLVKYFVNQYGAKDYNAGLMCAVLNGNDNLMNYFIKQGARNWNLGYLGARCRKCVESMNFFIDKGADKQFECSICLKDIEEEDMKFMDCAHFFHKTCINDWREISNTCPICRRQINRVYILL